LKHVRPFLDLSMVRKAEQQPDGQQNEAVGKMPGRLQPTPSLPAVMRQLGALPGSGRAGRVDGAAFANGASQSGGKDPFADSALIEKSS
jgi:hypothetical protein